MTTMLILSPSQRGLAGVLVLALGLLSAGAVHGPFRDSADVTITPSSRAVTPPSISDEPAAVTGTPVTFSSDPGVHDAARATNIADQGATKARGATIDAHPDSGTAGQDALTTDRATIIVDAAGEIASLQAAFAAAAPGDRIEVRSGHYHESELLIDKPLSIEGERGAVLVSRGGEQILTIASDGVSIRGMTFRGVSTSFVDDRSAIRVERASDCLIAENRFEDAFFGIYFARASRCTVDGNVMTASKSSQTKSGNGIHLWYSRDIDIRNNRIAGHRDGIYLEFSSGVTVTDNESVDNLRYGLHFMFSDSCSYNGNSFERNDAGVAVMYSKSVTVTRNRFVDNWGNSAFGLLLKDITDSAIRGNVFERNTVGIYAEGANRLEVEQNDFRGNGRAIKLMANSMNSVFRDNNFVANTFDVTTNSRQSFSTFTGNYWDSYRGYDLDRDGTGDVPFYPVRLFALLVERHEPASILLRSLFVDLLDAAERVLPTLVPKAVVDAQPRMRPSAASSQENAPSHAARPALHLQKTSS